MFKEDLAEVLSTNIEKILHIISTVPQDRMGEQSSSYPPETLCHPLWTLGHLCVSMQGMREELTDDFSDFPALPPSWRELYGQESTPQSYLSIYHSKEELLAKLQQLLHRVKSRILSIPDQQWKGPMPDERYHHVFPSLAHVATGIFVEHTSTHVRMLLLWRFYVLGE